VASAFYHIIEQDEIGVAIKIWEDEGETVTIPKPVARV